MSKKESKSGTQAPPHRTTKAGVIPNQKKLPVPGSGRNKAAIGYNRITREWSQNV